MKRLYVRQPFDEWALKEEVLESFPEILDDLPSTERLLEIQKTKTVDHATMALATSIRNSPKFSKFVQAIDDQQVSEKTVARGFKFVLLPAMFHDSFPVVGGGGEHIMAVAQRLGFQIDKAQTGGRAGVIDNAKILKKWIEEQDSTSLGIVSLSKGSLEFRYAWNFLMNDAEKRKVKIWLNLSGFPHGSSLADHCLSTPKRKLRSQFILWASGLAKAALTETATNFDAWKTPWVLPESVRVMNFVPIPLSSHVQTSLVGRYLSLCRYGPNDGMTDCRRAIYLPGDVYPLWGADHFCRTPDIIPTLYKMFSYIKDHFEFS